MSSLKPSRVPCKIPLFPHVLFAALARDFRGLLCWNAMYTVDNVMPKSEISASAGLRRHGVSSNRFVEDVIKKKIFFLLGHPARFSRDRASTLESHRGAFWECLGSFREHLEHLRASSGRRWRYKSRFWEGSGVLGRLWEAFGNI